MTLGSKPGITVNVAKDINWREGARGNGRMGQSAYSDSVGDLKENQNPVMTY